ncbi:lasso peptide biosynthesis B2 protein [Bacillus hominis]|uniref:lasso peptide biosynthesis B2 protein n=1 Tax=Bacillus hominis TaxID=2817478 RepID=UPI001BB3FB21|nr:lasso peptide biosynthesis B2 protein [Bacillus hominis]
MCMRRKIKTLFLLNPRTIFLFGEAYLYLGLARISNFISFSKVAPKLGIHMEETVVISDPKNTIILKEVSEAIRIVSRHTFWESRCLVKAIAAMKMLERRKIESTLYLGTAREENGMLSAHAWLRSGSAYITGAEEMQRFTVVSKFAKTMD